MAETRTKKIAVIGVLTAIAYVVMVVGRIPMVMFLSYDPKDVIIVLAGFIYGPLVSFAIAAIVGLVEMVTVSDTGIIGAVMNILQSSCFACMAAFIYKKNRTMAGAVGGLVSGALLSTVVMILWNYLLTPIYMGLPRETVAGMLVPVFLPFNLIKGGLNSAIALLLYKPVVTALRRAGLIAASSGVSLNGKSAQVGLVIVAAAVLATCIFCALVLKGVV